jgi:uncharacterized protein (UPF0261 family)
LKVKSRSLIRQRNGKAAGPGKQFRHRHSFDPPRCWAAPRQNVGQPRIAFSSIGAKPTRRTFRAHVICYADAFVILSRGRAAGAVAWKKLVIARLGLTLNEVKTKDARAELAPDYHRKQAIGRSGLPLSISPGRQLVSS